MIQAKDFFKEAVLMGYSFFTGVPCSLLTPFINGVISEESLDYVAASNEGEALAIASGAHMAGRGAVVMCQNSGLGNMVNPITSLNFPFRIPALLIVTLRGEPGAADEPQHELMGAVTGSMLDTMRVPWEYFPAKKEDITGALERAAAKMSETGMPYGFVMKKGMVAEEELRSGPDRSPAVPNVTTEGEFIAPSAARLHRADAIRTVINAASKKDALIATTGKIGRELYTLKDSSSHLYVVGSMGCASGIGFGIQHAKPGQRVFVLDGDGAALMKMGTMATIGHYSPPKLVHIILDNEMHESTGGQPTVSDTVDFAAVASACGYSAGFRVDSMKGLENALNSARERPGPSLIHVKVATGSMAGLGRPEIKPFEVRERFMDFLKANDVEI